MDGQTRKAELLGQLNGSWLEWEKTLGEVGEGNWTTEGVVGNWSVKDLAAHLTFWERRPAKWLEAAVRGGRPEPAPLPRGLSEDEQNAWIYAQSRDLPPDEVMGESRRVHEEVVRRVGEMGEEELYTPREWLNNASLAEAMVGNTWEHYREHTKTVRDWWKGRS